MQEHEKQKTIEQLIATLQESEKLMNITEECAEIQQAASKAMRFGLNNHCPDKIDETNAENMMIEYYQLSVLIEQLQNEGLLPTFPNEHIEAIKKNKIEKVAYWRETSLNWQKLLELYDRQRLLELYDRQRCIGAEEIRLWEIAHRANKTDGKIKASETLTGEQSTDANTQLVYVNVESMGHSRSLPFMCKEEIEFWREKQKTMYHKNKTSRKLEKKQLKKMHGDCIWIEFINELKGVYNDTYAPYYGSVLGEDGNFETLRAESYVLVKEGMAFVVGLKIESYGKLWVAYKD